MACSHIAACPLFPLLNSSVGGWRRCYCDSQDGWRDCARYQQSVRGQFVPLSLLPNGRDARHLQNAGVGGEVGGTDGPTGQDDGHTSGSPRLADLLFEQASTPASTPTSGIRPDRLVPGQRPSPEPRMPSPMPRHVEHRAVPGRLWLKRIVEWMRTPA